MTKFTKSKFKDQKKTNKSKLSNIVCAKNKKKNKRNLNLVKHNKYFQDNDISMRIYTIKKQEDALNLNKKSLNNKFTKEQRRKKVMVKSLPVCTTKLNSQSVETFKPRENKAIGTKCKEEAHQIVPEQDISYIQQPSIIQTKYDEKLSNFSKSIENTTLSHYDTKLLNCDFCTDSFSCENILKDHKKRIHHVITISMESKQKRSRTIIEKHRRRFQEKQKDQNIIQAESEEKLLKYFQENHNTDKAINNINLMNTIHTVVSEQGGPLEKKHTSRLIRIQKRQEIIQKNLNINDTQLNIQASKILRSNRFNNEVTKNKIFKMSEKKRNNKKNLQKDHNLKLHNNIQINCDQEHEEHMSYRDNCGEENQIVSTSYKDTFTRNTILEHRINKSEKNNIESIVLEEENLMNSLEQRVKTRSAMKQKNQKKTLNDSTLTSYNVDIPKKKTIKSAYIDNQTVNKSEENVSEFMFENCTNERKLNKTKIPHILQVEQETIFENNLEIATHFHSKSNIFSCNLCNGTSSCNKVLKEYQNEDCSISNVTQHEKNLHNFVIKHSEKKLLKLQNNENVAQTISQTNLQNLVDSKLKNDCNILKFKGEDKYEMNKSVVNRKLNKNANGKLNEEIKSEGQIQENKTKQQKMYNTLKKCDHNVIETVKKTLRKRNFKNPSDIIIKASKTLTNNKKLIVPLIRIEDLSLYTLSQLICTPNYNETRIKNQEETTHYHSTRNIVQTQYSAYKQYKSIKIKKNDKINAENKNLKKCGDQNTCLDPVFRKKIKSIHLDQEGDTNLKHIDFVSKNQFTEKKLEEKEKEKTVCESNILSLPKIKDYSITESMCAQVNDIQRMLNISLKESNNFSVLISDQQNNGTLVNHESVFIKKHVNSRENGIKDIDTKVRNIKLKENKCKFPSNNEINETKTLQNNKSKLQDTQLLENIFKFFLKYKQNIVNNKTRNKLKIFNSKRRVRKSVVAMCANCKQVFNLLQQFSDKINFVEDENICIECTLCNVQINSLSHFQKHIMNIHLQCEGNLLTTGKPFAVEIINLNKEFNNNNNSCNNNDNNNKFHFECCCCLKIYKRIKNFKKHIEEVHYNFDHFNWNSITNAEKYRERLIETAETYKAYKSGQVFNSTYASNANPIVDITNNLAEISNQRKNHIIKTRNHIDEYCINTQKINLENNSNLILKVGLERKMSEVKQSSLQITTNTSKMKTDRQHLNNKEKNSNLKNLSNISLITQSEFPNLTNNQSNGKHKKSKTLYRAFSYVCDICSRSYKKKHTLLLHLSKHAVNSNTNISTNKEQKIPEILNDNIIKLKENRFLPNIYTKDSQEYCNSYNDCSILNSIAVNTHLVESKSNILTSKIINEEINNTKNKNAEHVIKENVILKTSGVLEYNYILYVTFKQKTKRGIKRQKSIKFNINIAKKCKIDNIGQEIIDNEIKHKFSISCTANSNFMFNKGKEEVMTYTPKEMRCNICDRKFNSQKILKEHMFFLHDSIFEDLKLSNLLMPCNNYNKLENMSINDINICRKEYNISPKRGLGLFTKKRNSMYGKKNCKIFSKCNSSNTNKKNKKWRCNPCKENFALIRNYLRHKYYYHNDKSVVHVCDNCNKVLTSVAMVNIHMCINVTSWNCKRCNLKFTNSISLTQHNINYHLETVGPHICDVCKLSFLTMYMLERHKSMHSTINNYSNVNNSIDLSISENSSLHHSLNNTSNSDIKFSEGKTYLMNEKLITFSNKNTTNLNVLNETANISLETGINLNVIPLLCNNEEVFKCKLCNIICLTKVQMKFHLEKWHCIEVEMCQLCNDLYIMDELTEHLINHHIVLDNLDLKQDNKERMEEFQNDAVRILGLKRLISLYEYQRFDSIAENTCFSCVTCLKEFSNLQSYKIHHLESHDMICLLCNIEFKHSFQALEHKMKIHISVNTYLWIVQKIIAIILQFNNYGSSLEDIILQYSEIRMYDNEKNFIYAKNDFTESFGIEISESS